MPENIHEHLDLSLYAVETASYQRLHIVDKTFSHWILSYVREGNVTLRSGDQTWHVQAGDLMLHPPHLPFSEIAPGPGIHQWMLLDVTISHNIELFRYYPVAPVVTIPADLHFPRLFEQLNALWHTTTPFRSMQATALAMQLCSCVLESWQRAGAPPRSPESLTPHDRFVDVIKYMSSSLEQKISRDDLASLVHLHPGYFDRAFHTVYGVSPMQMLRDLRLRQALRLLETTDLPLSAIALKCGLSDAGYFSRVFRQRYGQTPGNYRQGVKSAMTGYVSPLSTAP